MSWILQPWPWWFSGILIGLTVPAMFIFSGKAFGISSSLRHIGAMCAPKLKLAYYRDYNWKSYIWQLVFVVGVALGGLVAVNLLSAEPVEFLPATLKNSAGIPRLIIGGILVGFGTRYAGGCTSGHAITGLSNLNWPSLVATIFFFVGGLFVTWVLGGIIFPGI